MEAIDKRNIIIKDDNERETIKVINELTKSLSSSREILRINLIEINLPVNEISNIHQVINKFVTKYGYKELSRWNELQLKQAQSLLADILTQDLAYNMPIRNSKKTGKIIKLFYSL